MVVIDTHLIQRQVGLAIPPIQKGTDGNTAKPTSHIMSFSILYETLSAIVNTFRQAILHLVTGLLLIFHQLSCIGAIGIL